jgi:uncharacterized membrane protein
VAHARLVFSAKISRMPSLAFTVVLWVHIAAGTVALCVFWLPLVTRKGGPLHRRVGWVYVVAASTVALTAFVGCARMLTDANPRNDRAAIFLAYVGVLAGASAQIGVRALRTKDRTTPSRNPLDLAPPVLLLGGGVALAAFGLWNGVTLHVVFAALGFSIGATQLGFWLRAPVSRTARILQHMGGMGVSCITTVTAFLVVNSQRFFGVGTFNLFVWTVPAVVGGIGLRLWSRSYAQRSSATPGRSSTRASSSVHDGVVGKPAEQEHCAQHHHQETDGPCVS